MNPVWPTPLEEQLLLASFASDEVASAALARCCREWPRDGQEPAVLYLLPLVYRRWPAADNQVVALGRLAYLATWTRNRERMAQLAVIGARFRAAGIPWMVLKGAALSLRQYADLGLRAMADLDILIPPQDLGRAAGLLNRAAYRADEDATPDAILRQSRIRHAWQFFGEPDWNFDLHWRPVNRCYSPQVTRLFWEGAETVRFQDQHLLVPAPPDQLFHTCVHGLQWDWTRQIRWIGDALSILREPIDWERVCQLAEQARMSFRLAHGLAFLRERFGAAVPPDLAERLMRAALNWERGEYRLLLKPCPLGFCDSIAWHAYHFRRIRPFDDGWRQLPLPIAFPQYVAAFLDARGIRPSFEKLRPHLKSRLARLLPRAADRES